MYTRGHGLSTLTWTFTPLISLKEWDVGPALTWSCPINSIDWARITPLNLEIYYRAHKYLAGANFINWLKEIDFTDPGESAWFKHRPAFKSLSPWICLDYIRNFLGYIFSCLYTWLDYILVIYTSCLHRSQELRLYEIKAAEWASQQLLSINFELIPKFIGLFEPVVRSTRL